MSQPDIPVPQQPRRADHGVEGSHAIEFSCHKGIACWNACCSNIDISLTPYDVLRMKTRLGITSTEFLKDYTVPYEMEKDGIAGIKFRPIEGGSACRFMKPEGCDIYTDRPTACRYYPVALLSMRKQDEYVSTAIPTPSSRKTIARATRSIAVSPSPTIARSRASWSTTIWRAAGANWC
jgi:Fe-S-cluster containining protein